MHEGVTNYLTPYRVESGRALDIGGRDINGHARGLWPHLLWDVLDIREGDGVTIVADATAPLALFEDRFDLIICTETFEHLEGWPDIVVNAVAWLRPGGLFLATCAGPGFPEHSAEDGAPRLYPGEFYRNVAAVEVADVMRAAGLVVLDVSQEGNFTYAASRKAGLLCRTPSTS